MGREGAAVCEKALTCLSESVLAQIGQLFLLSQGTAGYTSLAVTGEIGEPASIWVLTLHLGVKDEPDWNPQRAHGMGSGPGTL